MEISEETFEVALVLGSGFVICLFYLGVADKGFAMLAPVFGLPRPSQNNASLREYKDLQTVDFQYSDIA